MPKFDTPEPVAVTIERVVGDVRIVASERTDTTVEVRPADAGKASDQRGAENTEVEFSNGKLLIRGPRPPTWFGKTEAVDIAIALPAGSSIDGESPMGSFMCEGRLGACRLRSAMGDLRVEQTGVLWAHTAMGAIVAGQVDGEADLKTAGPIRVGRIAGSALVKNSNGDTFIGEVGGDLLVRSANGDIEVGKAGAPVVAKTANGTVRVGETRGNALLETSAGDILIGIRPGTAAMLDVSTSFGRVINSLDAAGAPDESDETVEVTARTSYGDVVVSRSTN